MLLSISTLGSCWLHDVLSSRCCHFLQRCSRNLQSWLTLQPATENADYSGMVSALKVTLTGEIAPGQAQASATSGNREASSFLTLICSASCSFCLGRCRSHAPAILARKLQTVRAGRACTVRAQRVVFPISTEVPAGGAAPTVQWSVELSYNSKFSLHFDRLPYKTFTHQNYLDYLLCTLRFPKLPMEKLIHKVSYNFPSTHSKNIKAGNRISRSMNSIPIKCYTK